MGAKKSILAAVSILLAGSVLSQILGVLRESVLAAYFGASAGVDALIVAQTIPSLVIVAIGSFALGAVPVRSAIYSEQGEARAREYTVQVLQYTLIASTIVSGVLCVLSKELVAWVAPGFGAEQRLLTDKLVRIIFFSIPPASVTAVMIPFLQADGLFAMTATTGAVQNVVVVISILLSPRWGVPAVALGITLGGVAQILILGMVMYRHGYRFSGQLRVDRQLLSTLNAGAPLIGVALFGYIATVIERNLASGLPEGSIAALSYAQKLATLVTTFVGSSLAAAVFPRLADHASKNQITALKETLGRSLSGMNLVVIPLSAGMIAWRTPILRLLFERGQFTEATTVNTAYPLLFLALAIPAVSASHVMRRALMALRRGNSVMWATLVGLVAQIACYLLLIDYLGVGALAVGSAIGGVVILAYLSFDLWRCNAFSMTGATTRRFVMTIGMSVVSAFVLYYSLQVLGGTSGGNLVLLGRLVVSGLLGVVIYLVLASSLGALDMREGIRFVRVRLHQRKA